ncbi:oxygenase MpaB family protein [Nocardioides insulae]|uniref:oxygenase MpaB family protein n=1 Tax=Nocardioides insulae TaxID=394734 RepID=UPI0004070FB9|nr:oxygenase MpaB family protein [Nocardioides insulae]
MFGPVPVGRDDFRACIEEIRASVDDPKVGLFGPDSLMWEVNRRTVPYLLATSQAAFLDVAHPWIAQGVAEHSTLFTDPRMRARKTYNMLTSVVFADLPTVVRVSRAVHSLHTRVEGEVHADSGEFARPTAYAANELNALVWVHGASWYARLGMYERVVQPLTPAERDRFWQETKRYALCFGIPSDRLPATYADFEAYVADMLTNGQLAPSDASRRVMAFLATRIPERSRERLLAFNSLCLPERVREILELPEESDATRAHYRRVLRMLRATRALPPAIRDLPPYREARARLRGREIGPITRRMKVKIGGDAAARAPREVPA